MTIHVTSKETEDEIKQFPYLAKSKKTGAIFLLTSINKGVMLQYGTYWESTIQDFEDLSDLEILPKGYSVTITQSD